MMTRQQRMVVVDTWLTSGQTLLDYADRLGLEVDRLLGWIVDYGQPAALSTWIPVRILDGGIDRFPLGEASPGGGLKPGICPSHEYRHVWIPVVIRERA